MRWSPVAQSATQSPNHFAIDGSVQASIVAHRLQRVGPGLVLGDADACLMRGRNDSRLRMVEHQGEQSDTRVFVIPVDGLVNGFRSVSGAEWRKEGRPDSTRAAQQVAIVGYLACEP